MVRTADLTRISAIGHVCLAFVYIGVAGCYNVDEVKAFLREPRSPVSGTEYRVLPPDMLQIRSRRVPEIADLMQQVRPDGKINLPLVGEIAVAGRTPTEIEADLKKAASEYYDEVDATVQIVAYNSQRFYVFGQVARAGPMPWTGHDTLLDALAQAQPTILAWPERIIVVRGTNPTEGGHAATKPSGEYTRTGVHPVNKNNSCHKLTINLMAMVSSGDMANNIMLMPNDVIYVQPNPLAAVGLAVQNLLFPIRPAAETVRTPVATAQGLP